MKRGPVFCAGIFLCVFLSLCQARSNDLNWSGWTDTASVSFVDTQVYHYTKAFAFPQVDHPIAMLKVSDTTASGLSADTVNVVWGYQPGKLTLNSSGDKDTLWWYRATLDTMVSDSFGVIHAPARSAAGVYTRELAQSVDTSSVSGYAVQAEWYQGEAGWPLVRYWVFGLTGNQTNVSNIYVFEHNTREFVPVRNR